jgi:hypothetical protein
MLPSFAEFESTPLLSPRHPGREELRTVLDSLRKGDLLMVTRIDRLAQNIGDLQDIVAIKAKGAAHASSTPWRVCIAIAKALSIHRAIYRLFEEGVS